MQYEIKKSKSGLFFVMEGKNIVFVAANENAASKMISELLAKNVNDLIVIRKKDGKNV